MLVLVFPIRAYLSTKAPLLRNTPIVGVYYFVVVVDEAKTLRGGVSLRVIVVPSNISVGPDFESIVLSVFAVAAV